MRYQYLLFDLDGTLTDPEEGITTSVQYALRSFGIVEEDRRKLQPFIGPPLKASFMNFYGMSESQSRVAIEKYREWFTEKGIFQNKMYEGMEALLCELKQGGMLLGVASSKPQVFVEKILIYFGIASYFDVVVGSELDGSRDKKEEVIKEALHQLTILDVTTKEIDTDKCVMIGDREFDIWGGKCHNLATIGVSYGYANPGELQAAGADYIVDTIEELRALLMQ